MTVVDDYEIILIIVETNSTWLHNLGLIGGLASAVVFAATITIFIAIAVTINSKKRRKGIPFKICLILF